MQRGFANIAVLFGFVIVGAVFSVTLFGSKLLTNQYIERQSALILQDIASDIEDATDALTIQMPSPEPTIVQITDFRQRWQIVLDRQRALTSTRQRAPVQRAVSGFGTSPLPVATALPQVTGTASSSNVAENLIGAYYLEIAELENQIAQINAKYDELIKNGTGMEEIINAQRKDELSAFEIKRKIIQDKYSRQAVNSENR